MRIIAGTRKGMRLEAPPGLTVRPTSDLVRGAAMSQLGGFFDGGRVLDLCSGTGAVALEWLSRGCTSAVCVERDPAVVTRLLANARHTRLDGAIEVRCGDVRTELAALAARGDRFDFIWFDPPYDAGLHPAVLQALASLPLLAGGAEVLVESRSGLEPGWLGTRWSVLSSRRYGACVLDRLQRADRDDTNPASTAP